MKKHEIQMYEIQITVDTNDADFESSNCDISEKDLNKIRPLIEAIKNFKPYKTKIAHMGTHIHYSNYPSGECLREDLGEKYPQQLYIDIDEEVFELFEDYCPFGEYGFHKIENIIIYPLPIPGKEKLL